MPFFTDTATKKVPVKIEINASDDELKAKQEALTALGRNIDTRHLRELANLSKMPMINALLDHNMGSLMKYLRGK